MTDSRAKGGKEQFMRNEKRQGASEAIWLIRKNRSFILGMTAAMLAVFLPMIANELTNPYDGLWSANRYQAGIWELSIGRWLWPLLDRLRLGISTEPFISLFTFLLFSTGMFMILLLFQLNNTWTGFFTGMAVLVSTSVCVRFSYRYMAPTFGLSFLAASAAVVLLVKCRRKVVGWILGTVCIVCMLGLYQADLACTAVLADCIVIRMLLDKNERSSRIWQYILVQGSSILAGCLIYKVIWDLLLKLCSTEAAGYKGADSLSVFWMIKELPVHFARSYHAFYAFFCKNVLHHHVLQYTGIYGFMFAALLVFLVVLLVFKKLSLFRILSVLTALLLIPCMSGIFFLLAGDAGELMMQMTMGMALFTPIFCGLLLKEYSLMGLRETGKWKRVPVAGLFFLILLIGYGNVLMTGIDEHTMRQGKVTTTLLMNRVIADVENKQADPEGDRLIFAGSPDRNSLFAKDELWSMSNSYARFGEFMLGDACAGYSYGGLLRECGCRYYIESDPAIYHQIADSEKVQGMPSFPNAGYIRRIDGHLVIKLSD